MRLNMCQQVKSGVVVFGWKASRLLGQNGANGVKNPLQTCKMLRNLEKSASETSIKINPLQNGP